MKRTISCLLCIIMLISVFSGFGAGCADSLSGFNFDPQILSPNKLTFTPLANTFASGGTKTLTLGGVDISSYKIIYSENPLKAKYESSPYNKVVMQDTEYDRQTAENLAVLIERYFGVSLPVLKDTDTSTSTYEINVGNTNRGLKASVSSYLKGDKSYVIKESGGKLIICGASYGATWQAAEAFIEYCLSLGTDTVALSKNFVKSGEANMLIVGCIGDSLTKGSGSAQGNSQGNIDTQYDSDRRNIASYPAALQRIAWKQMVVYNYGLGSRTMADNFMWDDANDG